MPAFGIVICRTESTAAHFQQHTRSRDEVGRYSILQVDAYDSPGCVASAWLTRRCIPPGVARHAGIWQGPQGSLIQLPLPGLPLKALLL